MGELELIQKENENDLAVGENVQDYSVMEETRKVQNGKRNPPARNTSRFWFDRFLSVIQRQNPTVIDSLFLSQIAPNNEGKLLAQLKYLHVIDEYGKPTQLLSMLNMVGSEQKKGFQQMIHDSYGELMSEIMVEKAVPDDVVNYFIRRFAFTRDKAVNAAKFFLYLAEKGSLNVSTELSAMLTEKGSNGVSHASSVSMSQPSQRVVTERIPREKTARISKRAREDFQSNIASGIQTVINIKLDKDTPKEYWDRVLALLGERKDGQSLETDIPKESEEELS